MDFVQFVKLNPGYSHMSNRGKVVAIYLEKAAWLDLVLVREQLDLNYTVPPEVAQSVAESFNQLTPDEKDAVNSFRSTSTPARNGDWHTWKKKHLLKNPQDKGALEVLEYSFMGSKHKDNLGVMRYCDGNIVVENIAETRNWQLLLDRYSWQLSPRWRLSQSALSPVL